MDLPVFAYHPDPLASGSVVASDTTCVCCEEARGLIYVGPVYCEDDVGDEICPWCIADGSAHKKFDASFTDEASFPDGVAQSVIEEVAYRTPGFAAWQESEWLACCNDAAAFLEPVGYSEIQSRYPKAEGELMGFIVYKMEISGGAATRLLHSLDRDKGPTAYMFQCRHCDHQPAYVDMH